MGIEDPDPDVAEQQRPTAPSEEDDTAEVDEAGLAVPLEANPADVAEQHRDVPIEDQDELG
jgi:hypothetical protein